MSFNTACELGFRESLDEWEWLRDGDRRRSHDAVILVSDAAGKFIETHEHKGDFKTFESAPQFPFEHAYGF